jgi:hypothetical protein
VDGIRELNFYDLLIILILNTFDMVYHFLNATSVEVSLPELQKPVPQCRVES